MTDFITDSQLQYRNRATKLKSRPYKATDPSQLYMIKPSPNTWGEPQTLEASQGYALGFFGCCGTGILSLLQPESAEEIHQVMAGKYSNLLYLAAGHQTAIRAVLKKLGYKDVHVYRNLNSGNHVYIMSWTREGCEGTISLSGEIK